MNEDRYTFYPVSEATSPTRGTYFRRVADSWWIVHPNKGLVFYSFGRRTGLGSPQCNANETITRKLANDGLYEFPHEIKFIPLVWVPVSPNEFV